MIARLNCSMRTAPYIILNKHLPLLAAVTAIIIVLFPNVSIADGGGVLLLLLSPTAFISGNLIVILIEYIYLFFLLKTTPKAELLYKVILINAVSFFLGLVAFPLIVGAIGILGSRLWEKGGSSFGGFLMGLSTTVGGDHSPYALLALIMIPVYYFISYLITVWIEYKIMFYLNEDEFKSLGIGNKALLKHSFTWNFISYSFILAYILFIYIIWGNQPSFWLHDFLLYLGNLI